MKKTRKIVFPIVVVLIFVFAYLAFFGVSNWYGDKETVYFKGANDIRWGIDIRGGVEAVFAPENKDGSAITDDMMTAAESVLKLRLVGQNITDYEVYTDNDANQIIVRFPWQSDEADYDPAAAIEELGAQAIVKFVEDHPAGLCRR